MDIIAHRGAARDAPENTLAAVNLAWQQKADAVEVDVQLSKDGKLMVIHDHNTRRTGQVNRRIGDQTLAELRSLDVGRWRLFVELKCGPDGISEFVRIARSVAKRPPAMVAIGFSRPLMKQVKAQMPGLEVCWITRFRRNWNTGRRSRAVEELIAAARETGLDGVDLDASGPVNAALVNQLKAAGLKVYVWTVDSPAKARKLVAAGVDGITTNRPGWLREKLAHARRTG
ncbi:MAG: glycerophosphodiester phosphodiesterase [Verrucomicrobia bacterium]|nr:MAG: glycerophosphodiester phosphodiesterase [Verrucomicrobiota bacterium]